MRSLRRWLWPRWIRSGRVIVGLLAVVFVLGAAVFAPQLAPHDPAEHVCPAFWKIAVATPCTAKSRSASANTMFGDLPPSSSEIFLKLAAAREATRDPVAEPDIEQNTGVIICFDRF